MKYAKKLLSLLLVLCMLSGITPTAFAAHSPFSDVTETDYFYQPILWAVENNITSGIGDGQFAPMRNCTRGQVVTFL